MNEIIMVLMVKMDRQRGRTLCIIGCKARDKNSASSHDPRVRWSKTRPLGVGLVGVRLSFLSLFFLFLFNLKQSMIN